MTFNFVPMKNLGIKRSAFQSFSLCDLRSLFFVEKVITKWSQFMVFSSAVEQTASFALLLFIPPSRE
jgi:hypothetical protein